MARAKGTAKGLPYEMVSEILNHLFGVMMRLNWSSASCNLFFDHHGGSLED